MDELFTLSRAIEKRQLAEYKMQLAIISNPHMKNPQALLDALNKKSGGELRDEKLDKDSFTRLREQLSRSKSIKVK
jgi:hypothetical protein